MNPIHTEDRYIFSEDELLAEIFKFHQAPDFKSLHIMCGHFMLFYDKSSNRLVPGIFEDIAHEPLRSIIKDRVGVFPSYSWDLGIKISDSYMRATGLPAHLILLINDWQYTPPPNISEDLRANFYSSFNHLPKTYAKRLKRSSLTAIQNIAASRRHFLCFPETWLKNRFQNEATRLVKQGKLHNRCLPGKPEMSEISYIDSLGHEMPLVSCGMTACAGEITEMISEAYRGGARLLVLLAPSECHNPIRKGVEIALSLYNLDPMKVLVADLGGAGETTSAEIYTRGVHMVMYSTLGDVNEQ